MITRLHQNILGTVTLPPFRENDFSEVIVENAAREMLRLHLSTSGTWRTGQLYGYVLHSRLIVTHAAIGGYPLWQPQPLTGTAPYQLGFLDGVRSCGYTESDWVGHWVTRPDNALPSLHNSTNWLRYGTPRGLFDTQHILLSVGFQDHRLTAECFHNVEDRVEQLPVSLVNV